MATTSENNIETLKVTVQKQIAEGNLTEAIQRLLAINKLEPRYKNELLLHMGEARRLEREARIGLNPGRSDEGRRRVTAAILELVDELSARIQRSALPSDVPPVTSLQSAAELELLHQSLDRLRKPDVIFFSYSHKDETLRDELETHLKLLQRQQIISTWHDRKILPGANWEAEIDSHMQSANIILLLISADFMASEYCWGKELKFALKRHEAKGATVIPIIIRPCDWQSAPFGKLQGLPKDMKPVVAWPDRDAAWTDVARGIRTVAEKPRVL